MFNAETRESYPILVTVLNALLEWTPTKGRPGSAVRTLVGDIKAHGMTLLHNDAIDEPLIRCFDLARQCGVTLMQMEQVRRVASAQVAESVGAIMTKDTLVELALMTQGQTLANTKFISRQDVSDALTMMNAAFEDIEEQLADQMDSMIYRAVIGLHAAVVAYLTETARPLPRMVNYRFYTVMSSLAMANRLYTNAGRADELRAENKVVHPAFMPRLGVALSA